MCRYDDVMGAVSEDVQPLFAPAAATRTTVQEDNGLDVEAIERAYGNKILRR